jgi:hypothetical protein
MYSTLTKAPKHAVVVISELLAAHGHQFAMVKPTYPTVVAFSVWVVG